MLDVITHLCPNINGALAKLPLISQVWNGIQPLYVNVITFSYPKLNTGCAEFKKKMQVGKIWENWYEYVLDCRMWPFAAYHLVETRQLCHVTRSNRTGTLRSNNVVITSKRRHFDIITSQICRFDVITTFLLRHVFRENKRSTFKQKRNMPIIVSLSRHAWLPG